MQNNTETFFKICFTFWSELSIFSHIQSNYPIITELIYIQKSYTVGKLAKATWIIHLFYPKLCILVLQRSNMYPYGINMYTYCTIMHPLLVKKVRKCPFEDTVPVTSCCYPKGTMLALFFKSVQNKCKNVQHSPLKKTPYNCYIFHAQHASVTKHS